MSKHNPTGKRVKSRPGRRQVVEAKRAAAEMVTVEDVAAKLGIGRNQAYDAVKSGLIPSLRLGRRWLISRRTLERLLNGEAVAAS
jgi:excisionase family DNA binding protein